MIKTPIILGYFQELEREFASKKFAFPEVLIKVEEAHRIKLSSWEMRKAFIRDVLEDNALFFFNTRIWYSTKAEFPYRYVKSLPETNAVGYLISNAWYSALDNTIVLSEDEKDRLLSFAGVMVSFTTLFDELCDDCPEYYRSIKEIINSEALKKIFEQKTTYPTWRDAETLSKPAVVATCAKLLAGYLKYSLVLLKTVEVDRAEYTEYFKSLITNMYYAQIRSMRTFLLVAPTEQTRSALYNKTVTNGVALILPIALAKNVKFSDFLTTAHLMTKFGEILLRLDDAIDFIDDTFGGKWNSLSLAMYDQGLISGQEFEEDIINIAISSGFLKIFLQGLAVDYKALLPELRAKNVDVDMLHTIVVLWISSWMTNQQTKQLRRVAD